MERETSHYFKDMETKSDEVIIDSLNSILKREATLRKRYSKLGTILEKQLIQSSFLNPIFKKASSTRRKVCLELNPLLDITNYISSILVGRPLEMVDDKITYRIPSQMQFNFS